MGQREFYAVFETLMVLFEMFIVHEYLRVFFIRKDRKKEHLLLAYALFFVILSLASVFWPAPAVLLVVTVLGIFSLSLLFYEGSLAVHFLASALFVLMVVLCEAFVSYFGSFLLNIPLTSVLEDSPYYIGFCIASSVLELLLSKVMNLLFGKGRSDLDFRACAPLLAVQIVSIVFVYVLFTYSYLEFYKNKLLCLFSVGALIYLNVMILIYFNNVVAGIRAEKEKAVAEKQLEQQRNYYQQLIVNQKEINGLLHDFKKHIRTLDRLLALEDRAAALGYMAELDRSLQDVAPVVETGNAVINALLSDAMVRAESLGIRLAADVSVPPALPIASSDLCVILGNTLENALEACADNRCRQIEVTLKVKNGFFLYSIQNSMGSLRPIRNPDGSYRSTKRNNVRHGYGLQNVSKTVRNNNGRLLVEQKDGVFEVSVVLPCPEPGTVPAGQSVS